MRHNAAQESIVPARQAPPISPTSRNAESIFEGEGRSPVYPQLQLDGPSARTVNLGAVSYVVLAPTQKCGILAAGAVVDVDETQLLHTGSKVHDGPAGRFAIAISTLLAEKDAFAPDSEEHARIARTGSAFDAETWKLFSSLAGKSETLARIGMIQIVKEHYGISLSEERFRDVMKNDILQQSRFSRWMEEVEADRGLAKILGAMRDAGCGLSVCSASSYTFVKQAMDFRGMAEFFPEENYVCSADKKIGTNLFDGKCIVEACNRARVRPGITVMFGDSISDIGSAAMGQVPLVIIRIAGSEKKETIRQLEQQIASWASGQGKELGKLGYRHMPSVVVVEDFSQVYFHSKMVNGGRSTFMVNHRDSEVVQ